MTAPDVPMPRDLTEEAVARMLRAAWIADEPIPAAGSFDEIGPLMRKAWMATARAVLALVEAKVREGVAEAVYTVRFDEETVAYARTLNGANRVIDAVTEVVMRKETTNG